MAINWRQVAAPDFSGASEILQRAVNNLTGGFDRLGGAIGGFGEARGKVASNRALDILSRVQTEAGVAPAMDQVASLVRPSEMTPALQLAMTQLAPQASQMDNRRTLAGIATDENARAQTRFGWEGDARTTRERTAGVMAGRWENAINQGVGPGSIAPDSVYAAASDAFRPHIDRILPGESQGNFDALYGSGNSVFAGVKPTQMTVDQWLAFQKDRSSSSYGSYVRANNGGTLSTPMGGFQIVGDTLEAAKKGMGLRGDEMMTPEMQTQVADWIFQTQGTGAWEGYGKGGGSPAQMRAYNQDPLASQLSPEDLAAVARNGLMGEFIKDPYTQYNTVRTNEAASFASELTNEQNAVAWSDTLQARAEAERLKVDTELMTVELRDMMKASPNASPEDWKREILLRDDWDQKKKDLALSVLGNQLAGTQEVINAPAPDYVPSQEEQFASTQVGKLTGDAEAMVTHFMNTDATQLSLGLTLQKSMDDEASTDKTKSTAETFDEDDGGIFENLFGQSADDVQDVVNELYDNLRKEGKMVQKSTLMGLTRAAAREGLLGQSVDEAGLREVLGAWESSEKFVSASAQGREVAEALAKAQSGKAALEANQRERAILLNGTRNTTSPEVKKRLAELDREQAQIIADTEAASFLVQDRVTQNNPQARIDYHKARQAYFDGQTSYYKNQRTASEAAASKAGAARVDLAGLRPEGSVAQAAAEAEAGRTAQAVTAALDGAGAGAGAAGRSATSEPNPSYAATQRARAQEPAEDPALRGFSRLTPVDPKASDVAQTGQNQANRMALNNNVRMIQNQVAVAFGQDNLTETLFGGVIDSFQSQEEKAARVKRREEAATINDWFDQAGRRLLAEKPELMEEAYRDPVAFYKKHGKKK